MNQLDLKGRNAVVTGGAAGIGLAFLLDFLDDSVRTSDDITRHLGLPTLALIPHYSVGSNRKMLPGVGAVGGAGPARKPGRNHEGRPWQIRDAQRRKAV